VIIRRKELDMPAESEKNPRKSGEPSGEASRARRTTSGPELSAELVSFTIDVKSGRIAKVEAVDPSGDHRELSEAETLRLASQRVATLEDVLERAFEAGISSVLDEAPIEEAEAETEEETRLRRLILRPMIERSAARHLLKREVLGRAILGTLIENAVASQTFESKAAPSPSRPSAAGGGRRPPPRGRPH
jgi:hypothetical protein